MAKVKRLLRRLSVLYWSFRTVPWRGVMRLHDRSAPTVFWVHGRKPGSWFRYLAHEDTVMLDAGRLRALVQCGVPFALALGRGIDSVTDRTVVYTIHPYNPTGESSSSRGLRVALAAVSDRRNRLVPPLEEALFWENKGHMHECFEAIGVPTPATRMIRSGESLDRLDLALPLMVKHPWSYGSYGVERVTDGAGLRSAVMQILDQGCDAAIVQEFIDFRVEARVTVAAGEMAHALLRRNIGDKWTLTLSRFGTVYEYGTFPEQWSGLFVRIAERLGLSNGAFDACWRDDDLTTEPLVFEVSPAYQLHPEPPEAFRRRRYREYVATWWGPDCHPARQAALVAEVQLRTLAAEQLP
jgi:hypothetical protein